MVDENKSYSFSAPGSDLVAPAAHKLVINLLSNHGTEVRGGALTASFDILRSGEKFSLPLLPYLKFETASIFRSSVA